MIVKMSFVTFTCPSKDVNKILNKYFSKYEIHLEPYIGCENIMDSAHSTISGWMSTGDALAFQKDIILESNIFATIFEPTQLSQTVPTKLKNPRLIRPFELFVKMYGMPSYGELDPTLFICITYTILFGAMFGDLGQGLFLFVIGLLLYLYKKRPLSAIISWVGLSSAIFGYLYGSVFGFENIINHTLVNPRHSTITLPIVGEFNTIFVLAILFGSFLIITTMIINIINAIRNKNYIKIFLDADTLNGLLFYLSVITIVLNFMTGNNTKNLFLPKLIITASLLLISLRTPLINLIKKESRIFGGSVTMYFTQTLFELFEMLLSYFSNTLSFLRVGAFAISHSAIMEVVITFSGVFSGESTNIPLLIIGNLTVCGMECLVVGIQVLRLEYYELFGRFFSGHGTEFKPYSISNK